MPETNGQNKEKRMYLNRITLIGFIGSDAERKAANSTNIAIFSLATQTCVRRHPPCGQNIHVSGVSL